MNNRFKLQKLVLTGVLAATGCNGGQSQIAPPVSSYQSPSSQGAALANAPKATPKFTSLYSFKGGTTDGSSPRGGLTALNGVLYGTTNQGGTGGCKFVVGCGTVFSITQSGREKMLYSFQGYPSDGSDPAPTSMILRNGILYGTTVRGGSGGCKDLAGNVVGCGTVFSVSTAGQERVLYNFQGRSDGAFSDALTVVNGVFYGTTQQGGGVGCGGAGCGTVFSLTTSGQEKVLYSFTDASDGAYPSALMHVKRKLYGSTVIGGGYCYSNGQGCGTVFALTTSGKEKTRYAFSGGGDGSAPEGNLADLAGVLYGATASGGQFYCYDSYEGGCGTVYSITPSGQEQVLHTFSGVYSDGSLPYGGVIAMSGVLYGTTYEGGSARTGGYCDNGHSMSVGCGTVFSITTSGQENMLYSFSGGKDGGFPDGSLLAANRSLYGTTTTGGKNNLGTVFRLRP